MPSPAAVPVPPPAHPAPLLLTAPGADPADAIALVLAEDAAGALPAVLWWGPAAALAGSSAEAVAAAAGSRAGSPALPEHSRGLYTRPALRGHRPAPAPGEDPAWSTAFAGAVVTGGGDAAAVEATDPVAGLALRTELEALAGGTLRLRHRVTNRGASGYALEGLEVVVPLPDDAVEVLDLTGGHTHEKTPQRAPLRDGLWLRENRRGKTGLDATGLIAVGGAGFGFGAGTVRTASVAWSGNTVLRVERSAATATTLGGGELLLPGEVVLAPGESYATPWLHLATSDRGLDGAAAATHAWLRGLPAAPARPVPVVLNVWEAVWFDHDLPHLLHLLDLAAEVGVERFVLDDGWFGARRDDRAGLGDWTPSTDVWPDGLRPLADAVHAKGLQFGLWFEPEMVNPDSELARAHPDWVLSAGGRTPLLERSQLVLDLSRPEVREHLLEQISAVLTDARVDAVKWDHNRDLLEAGGGAAGGRPVVRAQTEGFYALLDALRARHPRVEWESCASGGGRIDPEVLTRAERVWTSDNTDAVARQDIQRWTAQLAPLELLGAHVSAPVSHQTGRVLPLALRAVTALFGSFGIEWDLTTASPAEREELAGWVAVYQQHRELVHSGRLLRADGPDPSVRVTGVVAPDRSQALVAQVQLAEVVSELPVPLRVPGLDPHRDYTASWVGPSGGAGGGGGAPVPANDRTLVDVDPAGPAGGRPLSGAVLAAVGLVLPRSRPLTATLVHLRAV